MDVQYGYYSTTVQMEDPIAHFAQLSNHQLQEGANVHIEDASNRAETPPPTYEHACYMATVLSSDRNIFNQVGPMTAQNYQNS